VLRARIDGYPPGFNFEGDSKSWITDSNIASRAADFAAFIKKKSAGFATNSLLVPFGSDFQYTHAAINYENMDRLMAYRLRVISITIKALD
jgi:hypothetical protein